MYVSHDTKALQRQKAPSRFEEGPHSVLDRPFDGYYYRAFAKTDFEEQWPGSAGAHVGVARPRNGRHTGGIMPIIARKAQKQYYTVVHL